MPTDLRHILNALVLKKRCTANPADRHRWDSAHLLFISAFGESEDREIAFALTETIHLMAEINEVIETHGGWPRAFTSAKDSEKRE